MAGRSCGVGGHVTSRTASDRWKKWPRWSQKLRAALNRLWKSIYIYSIVMTESNNNIHAVKVILLQHLLMSNVMYSCKNEGCITFLNSLQHSHSFIHVSDAFVRILRDEGIGALWSGTMSSLVLVSNPAIHFMVYEGIKRYMKQNTLENVSGIV